MKCLKVEKHKKWPPSHVKVEKTCGFIPGIPCRKTRPKAFHSYSFIKRSRKEAFNPVTVNFNQTFTMEMMTVSKILTSFWAMYFQVL